MSDQPRRPRVYIETSVVSYLTARLSRELIVAAQQQVTQQWWETRRAEYELYISQLVVREAGAGDEEAARRRLEILRPIPILTLDEEALTVAGMLLDQAILPRVAEQDALHIALAAVHGMDYLLTWNCRHIANAEIRRRVERFCLSRDLEAPIICTPFEILGEASHVD